MSAAAHRSRRLRLRIGAILLLAQGVLMELTVFICVLILLAMQVPQSTIITRVEVFALPYLNDNLYMMMAMSGAFATLRIVGAIGVLRNRLWALMLSLINCTVTLTLMIFLLPAGLLDGVFAGAALVLLLSGWIDPRRTIISTGHNSGAHSSAYPSPQASLEPEKVD